MVSAGGQLVPPEGQELTQCSAQDGSIEWGLHKKCDREF
jgi:hypothetical protein